MSISDQVAGTRRLRRQSRLSKGSRSKIQAARVDPFCPVLRSVSPNKKFGHTSARRKRQAPQCHCTKPRQLRFAKNSSTSRSSSGVSTTLSCSLGSVRATTAEMGSVELVFITT